MSSQRGESLMKAVLKCSGREVQCEPYDDEHVFVFSSYRPYGIAEAQLGWRHGNVVRKDKLDVEKA